MCGGGLLLTGGGNTSLLEIVGCDVDMFTAVQVTETLNWAGMVLWVVTTHTDTGCGAQVHNCTSIYNPSCIHNSITSRKQSRS